MLVVLLDLAAEVHQERAVGRVDDADVLELVERRGDRAPLLGPGGVDRDVADELVVLEVDDVDRADHAAGSPDRTGDAPEHAGLVADLDADRERVLGGG